MTCLGLAFRFMEEYWIEQILIIINQVYKDWENMSLNFTFFFGKTSFLIRILRISKRI